MQGWLREQRAARNWSWKADVSEMIWPQSLRVHFKDFGFNFEENENHGKDLGRGLTSLSFISVGPLAAGLSSANRGRGLGRGRRRAWCV